MFERNFDYTKLTPAKYNPRVIEEDDFEHLKKSIGHGMLKPVIATEKGKIIAGHQRSTAAKAIGVMSGPVYVIATLTVEDEIRFNQLHNGTDQDAKDDNASVSPCSTLDFVMVPADEIECNLRSSQQNVKSEICVLMNKYGNWGCAVANEDGDVISGSSYLVACKQMNIEARVRYVANDKTEILCELFGRSYGKFLYDKLERKSYVQSFAQMYRLRAGKRVQNESPNYTLLIERLEENPNIRIFDFGSGQGDYVKHLKSEGFDIDEVEFFRRRGGRQNLDKMSVRGMCKRLIKSLANHGRFDAVVCDFVINSVNSMETHNDVITCVKALCKPGGTIYFAGRSVKQMEERNNAKTCNDVRKRYIEFVDENGFSSIYRKGNWFFQKFHNDEQIDQICKYFGEKTNLHHGTCWWTDCVKVGEDPIEKIQESVGREFDLEWPNGDSVGYGEKMKEAITKAILAEKEA